MIKLSNTEQQMEANLQDITTFASLKSDPQASLGPNFTICSTISEETVEIQVFFTILDKNFHLHLGAVLAPGGAIYLYSPSSAFTTACPSKTLPPRQWTRGCLAVHTVTGHITFVVNGMVLEERVVEELKENSLNSPNNLTGRLLFGTYQSSVFWLTGVTGVNMVTGVNIFSMALTKERMMGLTRGGGEECGGEGDYLAWGDMEWQLKGEAEVTHIEEQLPCGGQDPDITLQCPAGQVVFLSPHYLMLKKHKSLYFFLKEEHQPCIGMSQLGLLMDSMSS